MENIEAEDFDYGEIEREYAAQEAAMASMQRQHMLSEKLKAQTLAHRQIVDECLEAAFLMVDMAYPERELTGYTPGTWQVEDPPPPCAMDTWARGVLPLKPRKKSPDSKPPSRSRAGGGSTSGLGLHRLSSGGASLQQGARPASASSRGSAGKAVAVTKKQLASMGSKGQEAVERLREEVEIRKRLQQKQQESLQKDEEERSKLEALQRQLRGKEYAYDYKGQVVVMAYVDPDALPAPLAAPTVGNIVAADPDKKRALSKAASQAKVGEPGEVTMKAKAVFAAVGKAAMAVAAPDFVEEHSDAQPPVIDLIKLEPGTTVRQGADVKKGPKKAASIANMTKLEYSRFAGSGGSPPDPLLASAGPATPPPSDPNGSATKSSGKAAGHSQRVQPVTAAKGSGGGTGVNRLPDVLRPDSKESPERPSWAKDAIPKRPVEPPPKPSTPDTNYSIINSPDWGANSSIGKTRGLGETSPPARPSKSRTSSKSPTHKFRDRTATHTTKTVADKA